jgi:catechol 2,3-dioxygenase-like lactoylglutathione lyase family enzyme
MDQRLSLVTLGVADLARARAFYEALGWRCGNDSEAQGVAFFQAGCMVVALWGRDELAEDCAMEPTPAGGFAGFALAYNARSPEEVDEVLAQAEAAGAEIRRSGAETSWGGYSGLFTDLDGHPWEVAHNPHWTIAEDGSLSI